MNIIWTGETKIQEFFSEIAVIQLKKVFTARADTSIKLSLTDEQL